MSAAAVLLLRTDRFGFNAVGRLRARPQRNLRGLLGTRICDSTPAGGSFRRVCCFAVLLRVLISSLASGFVLFVCFYRCGDAMVSPETSSNWVTNRENPLEIKLYSVFVDDNVLSQCTVSPCSRRKKTEVSYSLNLISFAVRK